MKVVAVVGARPQFIKAAMLQRALSRDQSMTEVMIHTGQHYDYAMSDASFQELSIRPPDFNLGIGSATHGQQTAKMLVGIEDVLLDVRPDWIVVFGDTNSTLAGALAAAKHNLNVTHVEAGLRSFNRSMPEEINRILADHASTLLFTPSTTVNKNLAREGLSPEAVVNVGDTMYDATLAKTETATRLVTAEKWPETKGRYAICTIHRQENTDDPARLRENRQALHEVAQHLPLVLPLHPRTARAASASGVDLGVDGVTGVPPVAYLEMQGLLQGASVVLTDSGGLQKEAYIHGVQCITLRHDAEWTETVDVGWNHVTGTDPDRILAAFAASQDPPVARQEIYGNGQSAQAIVRELKARTPDSGAIRQ